MAKDVMKTLEGLIFKQLMELPFPGAEPVVFAVHPLPPCECGCGLPARVEFKVGNGRAVSIVDPVAIDGLIAQLGRFRAELWPEDRADEGGEMFGMIDGSLRNKLYEQIIDLRPVPPRVDVGDRVTVYSGLLGLSYEWGRAEARVLEVAGDSVKVEFTHFEDDNVNRVKWIDPQLIADVIK